MFNLLPEEQKKSVHREYRLRLVTLAIFFLGLGGAIVFVILAPSFFVVDLKNSSLVDQQTKLEKENPELLNIKELESEIAQQKNKLKIISFENEISPSVMIEKILFDLVSGVTINSISLERKEDHVRISLRGHASKRDFLLAFSKKIEGENMFSEINLPVSDLAKDRDIDFSLSFVNNFDYEEQN